METAAIQRELPLVGAGDRPLERVFELLGGPTGVLKALQAQGIDIKTPWAVNKWLRAGRLPRTEYTGETSYAKALELAVNGQVTAEVMLEAGKRQQQAAGT